MMPTCMTKNLPDPRGAAINHVLKSWAEQEVSDDDLIRKGMELFDGLYEGLALAARSK